MQPPVSQELLRPGAKGQFLPTLQLLFQRPEGHEAAGGNNGTTV